MTGTTIVVPHHLPQTREERPKSGSKGRPLKKNRRNCPGLRTVIAGQSDLTRADFVCMGLETKLTVVSKGRVHIHLPNPIGCVQCIYNNIRKTLGGRIIHPFATMLSKRLRSARKQANWKWFKKTKEGLQTRSVYLKTFRKERKLLAYLQSNLPVITGRADYNKLWWIYNNILPYLFFFLWKDYDRLCLHYYEEAIYSELTRYRLIIGKSHDSFNRIYSIYRSSKTIERLHKLDGLLTSECTSSLSRRKALSSASDFLLGDASAPVFFS